MMILRRASATRPPAFRITWASPSSRPRARAGSWSQSVKHECISAAIDSESHLNEHPYMPRWQPSYQAGLTLSGLELVLMIDHHRGYLSERTMCLPFRRKLEVTFVERRSVFSIGDPKFFCDRHGNIRQVLTDGVVGFSRP